MCLPLLLILHVVISTATLPDMQLPEEDAYLAYHEPAGSEGDATGFDQIPDEDLVKALKGVSRSTSVRGWDDAQRRASSVVPSGWQQAQMLAEAAAHTSHTTVVKRKET